MSWQVSSTVYVGKNLLRVLEDGEGSSWVSVSDLQTALRVGNREARVLIGLNRREIAPHTTTLVGVDCQRLFGIGAGRRALITVEGLRAAFNHRFSQGSAGRHESRMRLIIDALDGIAAPAEDEEEHAATIRRAYAYLGPAPLIAIDERLFCHVDSLPTSPAALRMIRASLERFAETDELALVDLDEDSLPDGCPDGEWGALDAVTLLASPKLRRMIAAATLPGADELLARLGALELQVDALETRLAALTREEAA